MSSTQKSSNIIFNLIFNSGGFESGDFSRWTICPPKLYYDCIVCGHSLKKIQKDEHRAYCCSKCRVVGEL